MMRAIALVITAFGIGTETHAALRSHHSFRRELSEQLSCLAETVHLSLDGANITQNNLGEMGPNFNDDPIIMFENVGNYKGTDIDFVVSIKEGSEYVPRNSAANGMICGMKVDEETGETDKPIMCDMGQTGGTFGQINLDIEQETKIVFTFYKHESYHTDDPEPVVLDGFKASFFDIDQGGSNKNKEEYVVKGWETAMYNSSNTEALFNETDYGCKNVEENCLFAQSTMIGKSCDNPHDPMELSESYTCEGNTVNQFARSFQVDFKDKSSYELDFKVLRIPETEGGSGRNVVFAFKSSWDFKCTDPRDFELSDMCEEDL